MSTLNLKDNINLPQTPTHSAGAIPKNYADAISANLTSALNSAASSLQSSKLNNTFSEDEYGKVLSINEGGQVVPVMIIDALLPPLPDGATTSQRYALISVYNQDNQAWEFSWELIKDTLS